MTSVSVVLILRTNDNKRKAGYSVFINTVKKSVFSLGLTSFHGSSKLLGNRCGSSAANRAMRSRVFMAERVLHACP